MRLELLESRWLNAALPLGAEPNDTGEFMLGRVAVTPVFLESDGQIDASTENWNPAHVDEVFHNLTDGLNWWKELLATKSRVHTLDFIVDRTFVDQPVATAYEPINRVSNDYTLWTQEFLNRAGFNQSVSLETNIRAFNHAQRQKVGADWAFTIFVVNSQVEHDGTFASGGSFSRAFGFSGGMFFVIPSTRPAATFAHETGHMFWARDEYIGGGSYYQQRGYYNTLNANALDNNPDPNFQQAPSIMSSGAAMDAAYANLVSPASTLAMIGWQDSDGDGIFDVLDVPLRLEGVGRVDASAGIYRFTGSASVQTLPNRNGSGLGNDITLNKISRIEAKFSDGNWQVVAEPDAYEVPLNLSIALAGRQSGTLQLRAVDAVTGVTSNLFEGAIGAVPDATERPGINGFVWNDANANGLFDAIESGLGAQSVQLVDAAGQPLNLQRALEPDEKLPGAISASAYGGVFLTAAGPDTNGNVGVFNDSSATTGARVFRPYSIALGGYADTWNDRRQLKIAFASPTSFVSVDVIGSGQRSFGRLELYDSNGQLLERATTAALASGQVQTLQLGRPADDVAYALVRGHMGTGVKLDNLRFGPQTATTTDVFGHYSFDSLPQGTYNVQFVLSGVTSRVTSADGQVQNVALQLASPVEHVDFGINFQNTPWHNLRLAEDVNDDGYISALDALLVINLLNQTAGQSALTGSAIPFAPYIDVSNDAYITPLDALLVINALNARAGASEGESPIEIASPNGGAGSRKASVPGEDAFAQWSPPAAPTSETLSTLGATLATANNNVGWQRNRWLW